MAYYYMFVKVVGKTFNKIEAVDNTKRVVFFTKSTKKTYIALINVGQIFSQTPYHSLQNVIRDIMWVALKKKSTFKN